MSDVRYAKFRVGDLFEKLKFKKANPKFLSRERTAEYSVPVVYAKKDDNGIMYWGRKGDFTTYSNVLSVVYNGAVSAGMVYAQPFETGIRAESYFIRVRNVPVAFETNLYLAAVLEKAIYSKYSRDNLATWSNKVENDVIELPVTPVGTPDWDYMAEYIAELEAERIAELEAYLVATGLDDCELTDEDCEVLGRDVETKAFRVGDLFEKLECAYYGKGARYSDISDARSDEYPIPVTSAKSGNNGICRWAREGQFETYSNVISVVYNGAIAAGLAYYQPNAVSALADSYLVCLKNDKLDETLGLYLVSALQKVTKAKYSRENKAVWKRVSEDCIELPATPSGTPDWDYMRVYIRAQEKLVMAGVADMTQERIKATREIVKS